MNPLVDRFVVASGLDRQLARPSAKVARFALGRALARPKPSVTSMRLRRGESALVVHRSPRGRRARREARRATKRRHNREDQH